MSKFLEVEVKYDASDVTAKEFLQKIKKEFNHKFKHLKGKDYYYRKGSEAIRYRDTAELQELTIKKRHSKSHIRVRTEVNLELAKSRQPKEVEALLNLLGYKKEFLLYKEYYIMTFPLGSRISGVGEIVWYKVKSKGMKTRQFIEIEVRNSSDNKKHLAHLEGKLKDNLPQLQESKPLNQSLYEIYKKKDV